MKGKWLLLGAAVIFVAIAAGALSVVWKNRTQQQAAAKPASVLPPLPPGAEISLSGKLDAQHVVAVPAPSEGVVEEYLVEAGEEVFEGQPLARVASQARQTERDQAAVEVERAQNRVNTMESMVAQARLEASRAVAEASRSRGEYDRLEKIYKRQEMLNQEGATPRKLYDKALKEFNEVKIEYESLAARAQSAEDRLKDMQGNLETAKKQLDESSKALEQADAQLNAGSVISPVDGVVASLHGQAGEEVTPQIPDLVRIAVDLALLQVTVELEPRVLERLRPGSPALIRVSETNNEPVQGEVKEIKGNQVTIHIVSPNPVMKPGLVAQVTLKLM